LFDIKLLIQGQLGSFLNRLGLRECRWLNLLSSLLCNA